MDYEDAITPWEERDRHTQKEDLERQRAAFQIRELLKEWARAYTRMASALAKEFGEEEVLDILEQAWWDMQYEGGLSWRDEFEPDPQAGMERMFERWHAGTQGMTCGVYDVQLQPGRWDLLMLNCYHKDVALELDDIGGRKIGLSWCMADMAAVRGWCPRLRMRFPNMQLRGDPFCWQIREIVEEADPALDRWSRELSEQCGWRSIKRLEEE
jgi:hypothetical protein